MVAERSGRRRRRSRPVRVLGIETSGTVCGVAHLAARGGDFASMLEEGSVVVREHASEFARHSEAIYGLLDEVLRAARSRLDRLDVIAVSLGPGSFTGLRVGLAVAKVFARFGGIPLVGVPTLEVQAARAALKGGPGRYMAAVDAKRGEVYTATYAVGKDGRISKVRGPRVADPVALGRDLEPGTRYVAAPPRADLVAALGAIRFLRGRRDDPDRLVPVYVRRPAAVEKLRGKRRDSR